MNGDGDRTERFVRLTMLRLAGAELDRTQQAELEAIVRAHESHGPPVPPHGPQLN
jgi:hypothetical protein